MSCKGTGNWVAQMELEFKEHYKNSQVVVI